MLRSRLVRRARAQLAVWVLCAPLLCAAQSGAGRFYEDALIRFEKRDYAGAIVQLKNALQADRNALAAHVLLGRALLAHGEVNAAEVAFNDALRLGVNRAEVVVGLAQSYVAQGKQSQVLDESVFDPTGLPADVRARLLLERAVAAADIGDSRGSLRALEEARAIDARSADVWLAEVPLRIRNRQYAEAEAAITRAFALAPDSAEVWLHKGEIAHMRGDAKAALDAYERALKLRPGDVVVLGARAGLYADLRRDEDARRDVAVILERVPTDLRGLYLKALLADRAGDGKAARDALNEITRLIDPVPLAYIRYRPQLLMLAALAHNALNNRAKAKLLLETVVRTQGAGAASKLLAPIYLAENNIGLAVAVLENYLKQQPDDPQALTMLASTYMAQGRPARATNLMREALASRDAPAYRTMLGVSLMDGGQSQRAIAELQAAYRKDPKLAAAGAALASLFLQLRRPAQAVQIAEDLVRRNPDNAGFQHLLGTAYADGGNAARAREAFERALKIDGTLRGTRLSLARLELAGGAFEAAQSRIEAVLKANDKDVDALYEMGQLAERRRRVDEALRWYEKAADHAPSRELRPLLAVIELQLRSGQPAKAVEAATRLSAHAGETLPVLVASARALIADKRYDVAKSTLARASTLAESDAAAQVEVALLQSLAGDLAGAAYSLDKALAARPDFVPALGLLTEVDLRRGEVARAEQRARDLVQRHPKRAFGHRLLGDVALARRQPVAAVESYRRAHQLEPSSRTLVSLFDGLVAADQTGPAISLASQWVRTNPSDGAVWRALADAQARAADYPAARTSYEKLAALNPKDAGALNNLANVLLLQKDPQALTVAERALAANPEDANVLGTVGWAALKAGQTERALQLLREARLRNPANPETRYFLASALAQSGRGAEARVELQAALDSKVAFPSAKEAQALLRTLK